MGDSSGRSWSRSLLAATVIGACLIGMNGCELEESGDGSRSNVQKKQAKLEQKLARLKMERLRDHAQAKREAKAAARAAYRSAQATAAPEPEPEPAAECDPNYAGACLDPNAYDYDCEGGSGDGPEYTGYVEVVGSDPHDLDSDGDGIGCE